MARRETAKRHSLQSFIADQVISNVSRFSHFVDYLKHRSPKPFGKYCCHCPCRAVVAPYDHYGHKSETVFERCRLKIHSSEREVTETNDFMLSLLYGLSLESQLRNPFPFASTMGPQIRQRRACATAIGNWGNGERKPSPMAKNRISQLQRKRRDGWDGLISSSIFRWTTQHCEGVILYNISSLTCLSVCFALFVVVVVVAIVFFQN